MTTDTVQTFTARIVGVFEGNSGWHDIKTDGTPAKLSTKKAGNIAAARQAQASGQLVAVDYTQRQNGQYTNYYLEAVRQPAQDEVQNTPVSFAPVEENGARTQDEFRRSKEEMRLTDSALVAATILAPHLDIGAGENWGQFKTLALNIAEFIRQGK